MSSQAIDAISRSEIIERVWYELAGTVPGLTAMKVIVNSFQTTCGTWASDPQNPFSCDAVFLKAGAETLDVMAHEFQHGASQGLGLFQASDGYFQTASIDEHVSDVNGVLNRLLYGDGEWRVGDTSTCSVYRNICDPTCSNATTNCPHVCDPTRTHLQPASWNNYAFDTVNTTTTDLAHYNDGIGNKLAWLLGATAGTQHNWGGLTVPAMGTRTFGEAFFRMLTVYMPADPNDRVTWDVYREAWEKTAELDYPAYLDNVVKAVNAVGLWKIFDLSRVHTDYRGALVNTWDGSGNHYLWHFHHNPAGIQSFLNYERCGPGYGCSFDQPLAVSGTSPMDHGPYGIQLGSGKALVIYSKGDGLTFPLRYLMLAGDQLSSPQAFSGISQMKHGPAGVYTGTKLWYVYVDPNDQLKLCDVNLSTLNTCTATYSGPSANIGTSPTVLADGSTIWLFWPSSTTGKILFSASTDPTNTASWTTPSAVTQLANPYTGVPLESEAPLSLTQAFGRVYLSYSIRETSPFLPSDANRALAIHSFKLGSAGTIYDPSRAVLQNQLHYPLVTAYGTNQNDPRPTGDLHQWDDRLIMAYEYYSSHATDLDYPYPYGGIFFKAKTGL